MRKYLSALRAIFFCVLVFGPLVTINFLQMLSIVVKPFNIRLFRRYNRFWAQFYWSYIVWLSKNMGGMRLELSGDRLPPAENALVLANHQSSLDTIVQLTIGQTTQRLGDMKFFVKDVIKWVPGPGWGMVLLECIFMKRNWAQDKGRVVEQLRRFRQDKSPVWINIYPEGTRMKPEKLASAQDFARKSGLPIPQHVLIPRVRGFQATLEGLGDHLQAIYDLTIAYPEGPRTLWDLLAGRDIPVRVDIRRYPLTSLPSDPDAQAAWLLQVFAEKEQKFDALMSQKRSD